MAIDVARLAVQVDTTGLKKGQAELNTLATAGAKAGAAADQLSGKLATAGNQAQRYGTQVQGARMQTANIAAQFNDIGVMLASGQSPLMLALQQGTQLNQIFAQMGSGRQVLSGLAAGFMSMVNPLSLATIAIIAGGAALAQWGMKAFGASEESKKLAESLKEIEENAVQAREALRAARLGYSAAELQAVDAIAAKRAEILAAEQAVERAAGRNVSTMRHQLELRQGELAALEEQLATIRQAEQEVSLLEDGMSAAAIEAAKIAGLDLSKPISDAARSAAELAAQMGIAYEAAQLIKLEREGIAAQYALYGQGQQAMREQVANQRYSVSGRAFELPRTRSGGGGMSEQERQWQAAQREAKSLLDAARSAAEKYADEVARVNELQAMGALTASEAQKVLANLKDTYSEAGDSAKFWEQTNKQFNDGLLDAIVNGRELSDVFQQLARSIAKAALEAAFFNSGPFASGGGGLGGLFGGLFGGFRADGGPVDAGRAYVVGERGPEMFVPRNSGTIVPNGGGGTKVIVEASPYFDVRVQEVSGAVVSANNERIAREQGAAKW